MNHAQDDAFMDPNAPDHAAFPLGESEEDAALRNRLLRKRTKTGCLTCRRRRIKCGEERPICKNCTKSKRLCEGYNQRVTFRPQTIDFQHLSGGAANITFPASTMGLPMAAHSPGVPMPAGAYNHPDIQPRLQPLTIPQANDQHVLYGMPYSAPAYQQSWPIGSVYPDSATTTVRVQHQLHQQPPSHDYTSPTAHSTMSQYFPANAHYVPEQASQIHYTLQGAAPDARTNQILPTTPGSVHSVHWPQQQSSNNASSPYTGAPVSIQAVPAPSWPRAPPNLMPPTPVSAPLGQVWPAGAHDMGIVPSVEQSFVVTSAPYEDMSQYHIKTEATSSPDSYQYFEQQHVPDTLAAAAVEYHDDDYYDVDVQAEPDAFIPPSLDPTPQDDLALAHILRIGELQLNTSTRPALGYSEGILDTYRPEQVATPLKNPATARVFSHFVHVTSLTISSSDRGPINPPRLDRHMIPFAKRSLWGHTMPLESLKDQGLLQAILALSSLHIAKLTGASSTPSYKHYAYALKSVHQSVGKSKRRNSVSVMGASLLLAIYELWCAEHVKWSSHLAGEAQLLVEADFAQSQRQIQRLRLQKSADRQQGFASFRRRNPDGQMPGEEKLKMNQYRDLEQIPHINSHVVSIMAGRVVDYEDHGQILDTSTFDGHLADLDIPTHEAQKDLFWAYARQDMIGCIISANPLLMPYSRWTDCPPRANINDVDAPCGSHDHLILLIGRMCDFGVSDRKRKLKVMESNGGKWRPASWMNMARPTTSPAVRTPGSKFPSPTMPGYFGIAPVPPNPGMPSSYQAADGQDFPAASPERDDLDDVKEATRLAMMEWNSIVAALDTLESMLGEAFQPLASNPHAAPTPFGPPVAYRSKCVAGLWGYIMVARIFAHRLHPDMPPHAHVAAAVVAKQTMPYVMQIGRIAAGLLPPRTSRTIHPEVAGAMCDLCLPLFFAGVQVVDAAQREWIVTALFDIERQCAYETAGVIAHGCQTAWYNTGKADRGPRYELRFNVCAQDERLNGKWTTLDPREEPDQSDVTNRRFVNSRPAARLHWAVGILGTEGDG